MNMNVLKKYNSGQWGVFLIVIGIITLFFFNRCASPALIGRHQGFPDPIP